MLKEFKISQELKPYIRKILQKRDIPYRFLKKNEEFFVSVPLSGQRFHKIVQRAKCEKLTKETGVLHVSKEESENTTLLWLLLKENNCNGFVIAGTKKD